jgi:malonate decarboxylase epsilon subunit
MSLAFLFPGQGAQRPDMLHDLPSSPAITDVLDESSRHIDDLDTTEALESTVNVQIALLIAGVACARALTVDHGLTPQFVAGHSVGAFAAAVSAGVLTLSEALTAVELRGRLMEQACAHGDWGMAAVSGLPTRTAAEIVQKIAATGQSIWVANINSATQTVFSGSASALHAADDAAGQAGALNYELLDVAVASHCPIQRDTARGMAKHLAQLPRREPTARYITNTRGRATASAEVVLDDLAQAVAHPVQWHDGTRLMVELGVTFAIETLPGHVLTRLLSSATPSVVAMSLQDDDLAATAHRVHKVLQP